MKTRVKVLSVFVSLLLVATMFAFPSIGVKAGNGPQMDKNAYIMMQNDDSSYEFYLLGDGWAAYEEYGYVLSKYPKGMSYDQKSNTLTLTNYSGDHLSVNEMGEDFKIKLVGENKLLSLTAWGYYYGGCVTFTGKGSLDIDYALILRGEASNSNITVKKGATIRLDGYYDDINGMIIDTTSEKALVLEKGVKSNKSFYELIVPDATYDDDGNTLWLYSKDSKQYGVLVSIDENDNVSYAATGEDGKTENYKSTKAFYAAGFTPVPSGFKQFYSDGRGMVISSTEKIAAAPKASVKVSGNTAKFTIKKYTGAEGYEIRVYNNDYFYRNFEYAIKTLAKDGSAKRTYSLKKMPAGMYAAIIVPYTTVDGQKVYGTESAPVYFTVTK